VSLVDYRITVRNCNCIVTTAFSTGDDYSLAYPVVFTIENVLIMGTIITLGFIASH
jgi:hypothetical protein